MSDILVNKMVTPDGTVLESRHRHDYQSYVDTVSGEEYVLDGGLDYVRHSINVHRPTFFILYSNDPIELLREHFSWGTYGKNGDQPLKYVLLKDLEDIHIKNILNNMTLTYSFRTLFLQELSYRGVEVGDVSLWS